jgi:uncharacterized membrane protein
MISSSHVSKQMTDTHVTSNRSSRFIELDALRSFAVVGMVVFHFFFLLNYFGIGTFQMDSGMFLVLARLVQFSFLSLVGICLSISYQRRPRGFHSRQIKRGAAVLFFGLIITGVTFLAIPDAYVRFGILHLIGSSILLFHLIVPYPWISLILSGFLFFFTPAIRAMTFESSLFYIVGFKSFSGAAVDYFPLFPWASLVLLGIFLGNRFYDSGSRQYFLPSFLLSDQVRRFGLSGSWSLFIYIIHIPLLSGIILIGRFIF